jgi:hypothetical protein
VLPEGGTKRVSCSKPFFSLFRGEARERLFEVHCGPLAVFELLHKSSTLECTVSEGPLRLIAELAGRLARGEVLLENGVPVHSDVWCYVDGQHDLRQCIFDSLESSRRLQRVNVQVQGTCIGCHLQVKK